MVHRFQRAVRPLRRRCARQVRGSGGGGVQGAGQRVKYAGRAAGRTAWRRAKGGAVYKGVNSVFSDPRSRDPPACVACRPPG